MTLLRCPRCNKSIRQNWGKWSRDEPEITRRAYTCTHCNTRFIEIVKDYRVIGILEEKMNEEVVDRETKPQVRVDGQKTLDLF